MYRLLPFFFGISVVMGAQFRSDYLHRYKFFEEVDGWLKLHIVPAKWNDARLRCFLEGGNLASPVSKQMQDIMMYIQKERSVYTGISATFSKHDYFTVEGVPLSNIPADWLPGQPDNCEDKESCVIIHPNGGMDDVKCTEVHAYICYKKDTKTTMTECGTVDLEYKLDNRTGSCYKFHTIGQNFTRAFMTCTAEGGYLAIINSEIEAKVLVELFKQYPANTLVPPYNNCLLIGIHNWGEPGTFLTIHGQTLKDAGYAKWSAGQPDNAKMGFEREDRQPCGAIFRNGLLDDMWCHTNTPFICEKNPDTLLDNNYIMDV